MSVLCQPLNGPPGMIESLQLCFHSPTPGDLRSSSLMFPLWCPAKGCAGDVALLPSHDMSDPFPSSSHNDGTPYCPGYSEQEVLGWRWSQARIYAGFF